MVSLKGYEDFVQIHDSTNSRVYRARRTSDRLSVILKFLNRDYPSPEQIRRYKQEYRLTSQLDAPGIVRAYSLEEWERSYAIALEDFGGISLKQWLQNREKLTLKEFLEIAIATTNSLGRVHEQNIIHKDINPANIVINPETKELKIIDLGISTQLSRENPLLKNPNVLEGTLAYISPEQTGRMNRVLDRRTDFYSLGVAFYELLMGELPFIAEDALELVHCHIAKLPQFKDSNSKIPPVLQAIVLKLMAKNAEDRYQNAWGLKADLENCGQQLERTGEIASFPLGREDTSDRLQIPQKLYGRESEIEILLSAFQQIEITPLKKQARGVELVLISGESGIGKSALVRELYKPITARRGYFISGKFDQFQRNIPYSAIVAAFRSLIEQLLGEDRQRLQVWCKKILQALGNNGQLIIDVIPEVELIIGKQQPVPVLGANETQNRFNLTIGNFIRVFCNLEHPLVLFLDDLQWADSATLQLIEKLLIEGRTESLLLLGAYRDNEISHSHPLELFLEKFQQDSAVINQIKLNPLSLDGITNLLVDTLHQTPEAVGELARSLQAKTGGNPFFINEFLQALATEDLLRFETESRDWHWDIETIAARNFTDNVVALMVEKLEQLPETSREMLSIAACLGAEFDLTTLTWILERSPLDVFASLQIALDRNFILPRSELDENLLIQAYKFAHDRIQQAAYALIPEAEKAEKNLAIGRILLAKIPESDRADRLFEIVDRLDRGLTLVHNSEERERLARLNLQAGVKAREANAYEAAIAYFDTGLSLLDVLSWQTQYELTLSLYQEAAKANYLNANIERMEALAEVVAMEAQTPRDRLELAKIKVDAYTNQGQNMEAIRVGLEALQSLGIEFPLQPSQEDFSRGFSELQTLIGNRQPIEFADLPQIQDPLIYEILMLLVKIVPATYFAHPLLFALTIFKHVELSITYGNTAASAFSYASYGVILCNSGELELGYEYGQLALDIFEQFEDKTFAASICLIIHPLIDPWRIHLRKTLNPLQQGFKSGLEIGDLAYSGYIGNAHCLHLYLSGWELLETEREISRYVKIFEAIGQQSALKFTLPYWQIILNLQGQSQESHQLTGTVMQKQALILDYQENKNESGLCNLHILQLQLYYLFEEFDEARASSLLAQDHFAVTMNHSFLLLWHFYNALTMLSLCKKDRKAIEKSSKTQSDSENCDIYLSTVRESQKKLKRWAESAPMNYLHKFYLVEAESYQVLGKKTKAMDYYDLAIAGAKENEYIQEEALANELAAKFYLDWSFDSAQPEGKEKIARLYMREAHYCYQCWGAIAKVKHLEEHYPQLLQLQSDRAEISTLEKQPVPTTSTPSNIFDLETVIKATNAISSELVLEDLLATLIAILVENAGAERGILILPRGENLFIEAIKEADSDRIEVLQSLAVEECERISSKIVNYVARTGQTVVSGEAAKEHRFIDDRYIQQYQCQSIACTPFANQGKLQGIIYLENNLSAGAFTPERMTLLRTLGTQAAISLENARYYDACKRFVPDRFLDLLEKKSIIEVELGDRTEREMTVLFSDIRDFTTMSERITPAETFAFINSYLGRMEPLIQQHGGFIDKYIGDAIMALFDNTPDDALKAAIAMLKELQRYNQMRRQRDLSPIRIGIGLHTGKLILGTVGGSDRMDGTAIGDAVNLSSRVEGLTKTYGVSLLITHKTLASLNNSLEYDLRFIEQVKAKGKAKAVGLFEVFSADPPSLRDAKIAMKEKFERAVMLFHWRSLPEAARLFQECLDYHKSDRAARHYLDRCERLMG
ncbi:MAG: AAA family ATPase [Cyanobacteria bacterium P01_E01_bin.42]